MDRNEDGEVHLGGGGNLSEVMKRELPELLELVREEEAFGEVAKKR